MSKDFKDFKEGLQEVHFRLIAQAVNDAEIKTKMPVTPEGIKDFVNGIIAANTMVTLELLEAYHDWREHA